MKTGVTLPRSLLALDPIRSLFLVPLDVWRKVATEVSVELQLLREKWGLLLAGLIFQVWRVNDKDKVQLSPSDQSKFYTGDCYIFQYTYPGDDKEECLIGTWFGKKSIEEDRLIAVSLASKMVESAKFQAVQKKAEIVFNIRKISQWLQNF
ncbi:Villin-5 [Zea mays]|uniref:Villin-5 n=1 Tax=Zea mays TaxID=4577 RepID=A0A3L6DGJ7_MAIZE|nr:Villin-5 [Zea mays]